VSEGRPKRERSSRRIRSLAGRVGRVYREVVGVYRHWWLRIFLIALAIFIPLGLLDIAAEAAFESLNPDHDIEALAQLTTASVAIGMSMLGEVFLAGVIGISLADARDGKFPTIGHIARRIRYLRLIVLDLLYALLTLIGLILLVVPGIVLFVLLGLGGPVIEIEHRRVWAALRRSAALVRIDFWLVFWVLLPVAIVTNSISTGLEHMITGVLGHGILVTELASAVSEAVFSPLFAISAVLLTLHLIERNREAPEPRSESAATG